MAQFLKMLSLWSRKKLIQNNRQSNYNNPLDIVVAALNKLWIDWCKAVQYVTDEGKLRFGAKKQLRKT